MRNYLFSGRKRTFYGLISAYNVYFTNVSFSSRFTKRINSFDFCGHKTRRKEAVLFFVIDIYFVADMAVVVVQTEANRIQLGRRQSRGKKRTDGM